MTKASAPPCKRKSLLRALAWLLPVSLLGACATEQISQVSSRGLDSHMAQHLGLESCSVALAGHQTRARSGLDPSNIRLTSWNLEKISHPLASSDLDRLSLDTDLLLLQEASLREDTITDLDASRFWSFAPGFRSSEQISGVMTMSRVKPIASCSFVATEPFLRTPKATSITQYGLIGSDRTLVVVNMHAVNFSLGLNSFRRQFDAVRTALATHDGPVILSGDLNTWRAARLDIVNELASDLGLVAIQFDDDHRVSVFGQKLDHMYVRGLKPMGSSTYQVVTSDHNPMSATLSL